MIREALARLMDWLRRDRLERELREELHFHHEQLRHAALRRGVAPEEAHYMARRQLGNVPRHQEESRDRWTWPWLDRLVQDVRYAFRGLRRSPGFAATVIVTLGLGIGANAAMFGVIDQMMFRPFPYLRDPGAVHRVYLYSTYRGRTDISDGTEYARYLDFTKFTTTFSQFSGFAERSMAVGTGDAARERHVAVVNATFFDFFDLKPALGRFFGPAEDVTPKGANVVVLGYGYWEKEFGPRNVVGEQLQVRNILCTIVGVAPKGFVGVETGAPPELFMPITTFAGNSPNQRDQATYYTRYNWGWMSVMARRKPGVSVEDATRDLTQAHVKSWNVELDLNKRGATAAEARPGAIAGPLKSAGGPGAGLESRTLLWVTGVAGIVLLIACANVANLLLARVLKRQRETAVRLALGVSRGRLAMQHLTESVVLAGLGGVTGIFLAQWGGSVLRALFLPESTPLLVLTDWRTLGVVAGFAVLAGVLTGLAPAWLAARSDLAGQLKAGAREGKLQRSRTRGTLLVVQGALSVVLLVGAGLFVQSLRNVRAMRLGFDPEPMILVDRNLRGLAMSDSEQVVLGRRLLEAAQAMPGVEHAAFVSSVPFYSTSSTGLYIAGIDTVSKLGRFSYQSATSDYFPTMGTRILRGRPFNVTDRAGAPRVAVVSQSMAAVLWPGQEALGQCMRVGSDTMPCTSVIGIAEDAVQRSLSEDKRFQYYLPIEQKDPAEGFVVLLRMRGDPDRQIESVRKALQLVMPGQTYVNVRSFADLVDGQRRAWRVGATMFVAFGGLALLVAAVGLYGVITYNVAQRMHELGVRIALGARNADVVRLVVGQGIRFAVAGVVLGLGTAALLARFVQPLLFQQSARDAVTYGAVGALLIAVALAASSAPAWRATRADPNAALRSD